MTYWTDDQRLDIQQRVLDADQARALAKIKAPAQEDSPGLQSKDEGFESPGGRQPLWTERDAHNRELSARQDAKRQIIALLQDEITQLEEQKLT